VAVALIALSLGTSMLWAGAQARIRGKVADSNGKPIPSAVITITSDEVTDFEKVVDVKKDGSFTTLILDATKTYTFTVEAPGYRPYGEQVKVSVGTTDNFYEFVLRTEEEVQEEKREEMFEQPGYRELKEGTDKLNAGDLAGAATSFEAAIPHLSDPLPAYVGLADVTSRLKQHEAALKWAEKCLELDDEDTRCLAVAANSAQALGKTELRDQYMARYQALNPDDPATLFNQAAEHLNAMDDEAARPLLEKCLEVDPDFAKCLFEYGMLLLRSGDLEGAKANLSRYLEVAPDGPDASTARETIKYL
jgi:tetratricopeptide (TPR) repeat protein